MCSEKKWRGERQPGSQKKGICFFYSKNPWLPRVNYLRGCHLSVTGMMRYVIIGNGVAGTTAAHQIRKKDETGEITLLTQEPYPFYSRIRVIDFLSGAASMQDLLLKKEEWYKNLDITLRVNTTVTQIKPKAKQVVTREGETLKYDKLLLAMGGTPFVPPITGVSKKGVFTLRTIQDAYAILEYIKKEGNHVIAIGGGILGLEASNALRKQGCKITVIESFPRLLPRQMDTEGAGMLQEQLKEKGFTFYLGAKTHKITGKQQVDGIILDDNTHIKGDMVLLSAGIRPAVTLVQDLELDIDRGVKVNNQLQTSIPDIYAAGDLIQHKNRMYGIWPAAEKQGEIAGVNMAGEQRTYPGTTPSNILKVTGIDLFSTGDIDPDGQQESIIQKDKNRFIYKKIVLSNNTIIGAILYGDTQGRNRIMNAIQEKRDMGPHLQDLQNFQFENI